MNRTSITFMDTPCDVCGQMGKWTKMFEVPSADFTTSYGILQCSSCQAKRTFPFPVDIASLYTNTSYNRKQNSLFEICKGWMVRMEINRITNTIAGREFLDFGSGAGEFSYHLYRKGYSVICSDGGTRRPHYIENIEKISYHPFDFEHNTFKNGPPLTGKTVILRHVLEHIKNPRELLNYFIQKGIKYFYIAVPNADCLERKIFGRYDSMWYAPYHLWHFNKSSLNRLFEGLGITVERCGYDTIPTIIPHIHYYMLARRYPEFIRNIFHPSGTKIVLTSFLNLLFPNNVIWIIGERN